MISITTKQAESLELKIEAGIKAVKDAREVLREDLITMGLFHLRNQCENDPEMIRLFARISEKDLRIAIWLAIEDYDNSCYIGGIISKYEEEEEYHEQFVNRIANAGLYISDTFEWTA